MADGLAFVKAAAAKAAASAPSSESTARPASTPAAAAPPSADATTPDATPAGSAPAAAQQSPAPVTTTVAAGRADGPAEVAALPPPPPPPGGDQTGWGEAFGPPYSAIFVDVDNKDTSVGMSCPPATFLESSFLGSLKALLHGGGPGGAGGGGGGSGGHGGGGGPGVLAINVAARSKELFGGALEAVCAAFPGGEVKRVVGYCRVSVSSSYTALTIARKEAGRESSETYGSGNSWIIYRPIEIGESYVVRC